MNGKVVSLFTIVLLVPLASASPASIDSPLQQEDILKYLMNINDTSDEVKIKQFFNEYYRAEGFEDLYQMITALKEKAEYILMLSLIVGDIHLNIHEFRTVQLSAFHESKHFERLMQTIMDLAEKIDSHKLSSEIGKNIRNYLPPRRNISIHTSVIWSLARVDDFIEGLRVFISKLVNLQNNGNKLCSEFFNAKDCREIGALAFWLVVEEIMKLFYYLDESPSELDEINFLYYYLPFPGYNPKEILLRNYFRKIFEMESARDRLKNILDDTVF